MNEQGNVKNESRKLKWNEMFKNLKWYEILAACWPIVLVILGGAIGGACGGLACSLNIKLFNTKLSKPLKYIYSFLIGIGGILLYLFAIVLLATIFPNLFKR